MCFNQMHIRRETECYLVGDRSVTLLSTDKRVTALNERVTTLNNDLKKVVDALAQEIPTIKRLCEQNALFTSELVEQVEYLDNQTEELSHRLSVQEKLTKPFKRFF